MKFIAGKKYFIFGKFNAIRKQCWTKNNNSDEKYTHFGSPLQIGNKHFQNQQIFDPYSGRGKRKYYHKILSAKINVGL